MAFINISTADVAVDKPITSEWADNMIANDKFLNSQLGGIGNLNIDNGSFEILDTAVVGGAAQWDVTLYTGGAATVSTVSNHGQYSLKFTHPGGAGNGGGEALSGVYPVSTGFDYVVRWNQANNSSNTLNSGIYVVELDGSQSDLGSSIVLASISTKSSVVNFGTTNATYTPSAAGTRFVKIKIVGGTTVNSSAGVAYFDGIDIIPQVKQSFLKTATGVVGNSSLGTTDIVTVTMAEAAFFPSIGSNTTATDVLAVATTDASNIGRFGIQNKTSPGVRYQVNYRYMTNSEGYKACEFFDSSGHTHGVYSFSDAPPEWASIFDSMANSNGWTWQMTTKKNT